MPNFRSVVRSAADGCLLKPLLMGYFDSPAAITMTLRTGRTGDRDPDGWFHASAHPGLSEADLTAYLHGHLAAEDFSYVARMSMLFGSVTHSVVQHALVKLKIMVPVPRGTCPACGLPRPSKCREHAAVHEPTRSRGHLDGILLFPGSELPEPWGFDLKTIKPQLLWKAPDMDLEYFRATWQKHWWQMQEYMRLTGLRRYIVLYMAMGNPWDMREYHVPADPAAARDIERRYLAALART